MAATARTNARCTSSCWPTGTGSTTTPAATAPTSEAQVSRWVAAGCRVTVVAGEYPGGEARRALRPAARRAPHGHAHDGLPAGDAGGAARHRPRRRRRARGDQRDHVPHPAVAAQAARGDDPPRPPRAVPRGVPADRGAPLLAPRAAAAAAALPAARPSARSRAPRATTSSARASRARTSRSSTWAWTRRASRARSARPSRARSSSGGSRRTSAIERLFDVLEAVPGLNLDIVGEGDHRPDLEAEIERRGLAERVRDARLRGQPDARPSCTATRG